MKTLPLVDDVLGRRTLLRHPFYVRWNEGTLTRDMLGGYSCEYYALVRALPTWIGMVRGLAPADVQDDLLAHESEETAHIALWASFAKGLGVSKKRLTAHTLLDETQSALSTLNELCGSAYAAGAIALYTIEKASPEVSATKLAGLRTHYGWSSGAETTYFEVHAVRDVLHAQSWAQLVSGLKVSEAFMERTASLALDAQHQVLDGCERAYCS